jgi:hypothetical protein
VDPLTVFSLKSSIFRILTPCSQLNVSRRFGETCLLHLLDWMLFLPPDFTLVSILAFFYPADGWDMFFWNIGWLPTDCTVLYDRKYYSKYSVLMVRYISFSAVKEQTYQHTSRLQGKIAPILFICSYKSSQFPLDKRQKQFRLKFE